MDPINLQQAKEDLKLIERTIYGVLFEQINAFEKKYGLTVDLHYSRTRESVETKAGTMYGSEHFNVTLTANI